MIDTIVLRVHDLRRHSDLVSFVNTNFNGTTKNTAYLTEEEAGVIRNSPAIDGKTYIDYFWNSNSGTHLVRFKSQEKMNCSGHYYFHVIENIDKDYLEFNFSIPKYYFGTNVLMYVPHFWNKDFNYYYHSTLHQNLKEAYGRLISFIQFFFKKEFIYENMVDFSLVEVNRIDLCFNQVFDDKRSALEYLEYQKKLRKKNIRENSNSYRGYETSFMYASKRYSVKVYHKGTEYAKHDRKENERINKEKNFDYFNIDALQAFADRMLRYEVTFRDTMLSYLFNHGVFRKKCPIHKKRYEIFKKVESVKLKNDRTAVKTASKFMFESARKDFIENTPYIQIDKGDEDIHKKMSKLLNRKRQFLLKTNDRIEEYNTNTIRAYFEPRAHFSKQLFNECSKFFLSFIKEFQIKEKPSEAVVSNLIDNYNESNYHRLPKNEMMKFYIMLQNFTFEEILKKGIYSRATFYRHKSRFAKIGVTQNNIMLVDKVNAPLDLMSYHTELIYGNQLIKNKRQ